MSCKRVAVLIVAVVGLMGSPSVLAAVPAAPTLWDGTIVGADRQPLQAELDAYARPPGLGLNEGSAPLREIARTRTDGSGRYVLRSLHTEALRAAEDQDGWTNVMVAAFGDDGSFNLAFDSLSWVPAGGFHAQSADDPAKGRWVTTPAERLAAEDGEIRALSADANEDAAEVATEHPAVMILSGRGDRPISAQGSAPWPDKPADRNCMTVLKSEEIGNGIDTKVGEVHLDRDWTGNFSYSSTRSSSFQVGVRQAGRGWAVSGSTSSMQDSEFTNHSAPALPSQRLWNFAADLRYGHYWWRCYGAGARWYDAESIQPFTWKGGLNPSEGGPEPGCDPGHTSPVQGMGGKAERLARRSTTYDGAIQVLGFSGSVTTTHGDKAQTTWTNKAPQTRLLCGERADIADASRPTRVRSLP
jgi:hypothetical protein